MSIVALPQAGDRMARPTFSTTLFVQNVEKNLEYFTKTLGFAETERYVSPDGHVAHATVTFGKTGATVNLTPVEMVTSSEPGYDFGAFGQNIKNSPQTLGNGVLLSFAVPNVDKLFAKIQANGAIIDEPPTDQFWGDRTISVLTPDNYYLTFYKPIKGFKFAPEMGTIIRPKLSTAQRNQRKYAAKVKSIRGRAKAAKGGKGRIAKRPAAKKARAELGLNDGQ